MARALIIGPNEEAAIRKAVATARTKPIPWEVVRQTIVPRQSVETLTLDNRAPGHEHDRPMSEQVLIPHGYRMAVSFERQPAGLLAHFSFSVEARGKTPNPEAVVAMLEVAGFDLLKADACWNEEFLIDGRPGGIAVNLVFVVERSNQVAGHA